ncbi:Holliday junction branch migration protein RuvA [Lentibacillus sp. N15]|uniref:Holliday junction branch migration protein RuvA n=1 Tax=Lentibacillus songyuanensis TaxID=3136161 RepID=UPI0031BB956D
MIAYIKGIVTFIHDDSVIIDVQGVGYEIICANPFVFQSQLNKEAFVYTYHYVREDIQVLYGFKQKDEKMLFTKLLQVSGIGPKGALAILASVNTADFVAAVEQEDEKFLTSFPGIGKKTARQVILDLKGKLTMMLSLDAQSITKTGTPETDNKQLVEAQEALKTLGYSDREIKAITPKLQQENAGSTDELVRKALGLLIKS